MSIEIDRLKSRFNGLFENEGLTNIKFFIDRRCELSPKDFISELNTIQDTVAAGDITVIETLDDGLKSRKFNEPF